MAEELDLIAARESAERKISIWADGDDKEYMLGEPDTVKICRALLAVLDDPAAAMPKPIWRFVCGDANSQVLRSALGRWHAYQYKGAQCAGWAYRGVNGDEEERHTADSLSAAQSACENDLRKRVRQLFKSI